MAIAGWCPWPPESGCTYGRKKTEHCFATASMPQKPSPCPEDRLWEASQKMSPPRLDRAEAAAATGQHSCFSAQLPPGPRPGISEAWCPLGTGERLPSFQSPTASQGPFSTRARPLSKTPPAPSHLQPRCTRTPQPQQHRAEDAWWDEG